MQRTHIGDLKTKVSSEVKVAGWIDIRRDHGKLIFLDIRDASGKVQAVALPNHAEAHKLASTVRGEWVIEATGKVNERPAKMVNKDEPNGMIELELLSLLVLNEAKTPVFDVRGDGFEIDEESRLKYRYLDLRRPRLQKNLRNRSRNLQFMRTYLIERNFTEIETPILTKSTPEGARDYVVPSRLYHGKFYALPQSPQQYKQLLMVAGMERYFQFAKCLRDEDSRGDRQAEFTQLDIEMSFTNREEIMDLVEGMFTEMIETHYPEKHFLSKPWPRISYEEATAKYKTDKPDLRKDKNDKNELAFVWVIDFPLFEEKMEGGHYAPSHHMFTRPKEEDLSLLDSNPTKAKSYQYDLALNGYEVGGGSIRIHDPEIQSKIFDLIGFTEKQKEYFEHMLTAFRYGVPPHGGIAPGIDRLMMLLENEPNIREVMAFPKTGEGRDLMMDAPSDIDPKQLKELGIKMEKKGT